MVKSWVLAAPSFQSRSRRNSSSKLVHRLLHLAARMQRQRPGRSAPDGRSGSASTRAVSSATGPALAACFFSSSCACAASISARVRRSRPGRRSGSPRRCPDRPAPDAPGPARHRRRRSSAPPPGSRRRSAPHRPPRPRASISSAAASASRQPAVAGQRRQLVDEGLHLGSAAPRPGSLDRLALPEGIDRRDRLHAQLLRRSAGSRSTSTLTSRTLPPASVTAFSSTGPSVLQGPHHGAQKSTITGTSSTPRRHRP